MIARKSALRKGSPGGQRRAHASRGTASAESTEEIVREGIAAFSVEVLKRTAGGYAGSPQIG
jgi:hypothetical protein